MYAQVLEKIITLKDSVYQLNSAVALAEMQTSYDLQKKENIIINQKLDLVSKNYWLYGSLLLVVFGIITSLLLFKNYRRRQKIIFLSIREEEKRMAHQAVMAAEENERKRIAADLHDNMGAYAAAIIANVDEMTAKSHNGTKPVLHQLKSNAGEIMSNLRDTIWASNKERIFLTGISDRFKNYIQKISPAFPNIKVEIVEDIANDISFSPVHALNIFRIIQEAFTNALRHSAGNCVRVFFTSNGEMKINISDNGKAIPDFSYYKKGNGINNMKARAAESGFNLSINKKESGGTEIVLTN
jgi:signal transduction histidine kinase